MLSGNHVANFAETYAAMEVEGAARLVADADDLGERVEQLLSTPDLLKDMTDAVQRFVSGQVDQFDTIADRLIAALKLEP